MGGQPRELDLYASSTGYNARPRRRGANCTYSVREPTAASPAEKRVQIDYVLISAAFPGFFLIIVTPFLGDSLT